MRTRVHKPPRRLLLLRLGAIGDVVLTQPAIAALARCWPTTELIYVTSANCAPLLAHNPALQGTLAVPAGTTWPKLALMLRAQQADGLLDLQGKCRGWLLRALLPWQQAATYQARPLQERLMALGTGRYRQQRAVAWRYHETVERLVGQQLPREPLRHYVSQKQMAEATALLAQLQAEKGHTGDKPLLVVAPGARWWSKRWPSRHWLALLQALSQTPYQILLIGGPQEAALLTSLQRQVPACWLAPTTISLPLLAALIAKARLFVGQDSGPWHLARALQVPSVALFGSTASNIFDGGQHRLLAPTIGCSPCSFHGRANCPRGHFACMEQLSPQRVLSAILALLQGPARLDWVWG